MIENTTVASFVTAVVVDDADLEKWFTTIVDTNTLLLSQQSDAGWDVASPRLQTALAAQGFSSNRVEQLRLHLESMTFSGMSVKELTDALVAVPTDQLPAEYREHMWADYLAYLVDADVRWDGTADAWDSFYDVAMEHAQSYGVTTQAQQLIEDAASDDDPIGYLAYYGLADEPAAPAEQAEPIEYAETAEYAEQAEHTEAAEHAQYAEPTEQAETTQLSEFPTVRLGSQGEWVDYLRTMLAHHGHQAGEGSDFDAGLDRVVHDFQRTRGLAEDGVVAASTWTALQAPPVAGEPVTEPAAESTTEPTTELTAEIATETESDKELEELGPAELMEALTDEEFASEVQRLRENDPVFAEMSEEEVTALLKERVEQHLQSLVAAS